MAKWAPAKGDIMTEWDATRYSREATLQKVLAEAQLDRTRFSADERVLDVGCGDGKVTAEVAKRVPRGSVVGVDPSEHMIAFARQHIGPPRWSNVRFEVGDVCALPFQAAFDLVVSFHALHWVHAQQQALECIRAALTPGGRALLVMVLGGPRPSIEEVIEDVTREPRWAAAFAGFVRPWVHPEVEPFRRLAQACGFQVESVEAEDHAWDFGTREAFTAWCRATFAVWLDRLPAEQAEPFIADVLDHYQPQSGDGPGGPHTFRFYEMAARLTAV